MDFSISPTPTGVKIEGNNGVTTKTLLEFDNDGKVIGGEISDEVLKPSFNAAGLAPMYACRAWVNFNGTGVVAIRDSGNVSSVADLGTGNYTVNFTTAMPHENFVANLSVKMNSEGYNYAQITCSEYRYADSRSVSYIKLNCTYETSGTLNTPFDPEMYQLSVFC